MASELIGYSLVALGSGAYIALMYDTKKKKFYFHKKKSMLATCKKHIQTVAEMEAKLSSFSSADQKALLLTESLASLKIIKKNLLDIHSFLSHRTSLFFKAHPALVKIEALEQQLLSCEADMIFPAQGIERLEEAEEKFSTLLADGFLQASTTELHLATNQANTCYSFPALVHRIQEELENLTAMKHAYRYDPLSRNNELFMIAKRLKQIEEEIHLINGLFEESSTLHQKISFVREEIQKIIQQEQLPNIEFQPVKTLTWCEEQIQIFDHHFQQGEIVKAASLLTDILKELDGTYRTIKDLVHRKRVNLKEVYQVENSLSDYPDSLRFSFQREYEQLQKAFSPVHYQDLPTSFQHLFHLKKEVQEKCLSAKSFHTSSQKYFAAKQEIDCCRQHLSAMSQLKKECLSTYQTLTVEYLRLKKEFQSISAEFDLVYNQLLLNKASDFPELIHELLSLKKRMVQLGGKFQARPLNLFEMADDLTSLQADHHSFSAQVTDTLRAMHQMTVAYPKLKRQFSRLYTAGDHDELHTYSDAYHQLVQEIDEAIRKKNYRLCHTLIENLHELLSSLEAPA